MVLYWIPVLLKFLFFSFCFYEHSLKNFAADMQKTTQESSVQCSLIGETFLFNVDERLSDPDLNTSEKSDELPSSPPPIVNGFFSYFPIHYLNSCSI